MKRASKKRQTPIERAEITMLPISKIRRDGGTQSRESINPTLVEEYADDMERGDVFPSLDVFHDGKDYWLSRGHHRIEAAERIGRKVIACTVHEGTRRDAILHCVGSNAAHGCRRTPADKRRCVLMLLADAQWRKWSDRRIAEVARVSHTFASALRRDAGDDAQTAERLVTRGGTTYTMTLPAADVQLTPAAGGLVENAPLKWHGGKQPIARRIVGLMPPHTTYVETHAGGLAVLLAKPPGDVSEIVNDADGALVNFWTVIREPKLFRQLLRAAQATPFCESIWRTCEAEMKSDDPARAAWAFLVRCRQSLAGRMKSFAPMTITRTRRGMNEQASSWLSAVDALPQAHERLKRVAILNRDALDVIRQHDAPGTLFYCDPPYVPESRATPDVYAHEMSVEQHEQLLDVLSRCVGKVILSGYPCELYDRKLRGAWQRVEIERPNSAAGGKGKRRMIEALWCNFAVAAPAERKSA